MKTTLENVQQHINSQQAMLDFFLGEKIVFETTIRVGSYDLIYIGPGSKEEPLSEKYKIGPNEIFCIYQSGLYIYCDNNQRGISEDPYFVEKKFFDANKNLFVPPITPKDITLRTVTIGDMTFVSIGMGDGKESLLTKYNIDTEDLYSLSPSLNASHNYCRGWDKIEYWVRMEYYGRNFDKFAKILPVKK